MKKSISLSLIIIFIVTLSVNHQLKAQTIMLPNGKMVNETPLAYTPDIDDLLFGYSTYSVNNVIVLNGVDVTLQNTGWFTDSGEHSSSNYNYLCGQVAGYGYYRNFFAVDLSDLATDYGITLPITSAILKIDKYESEPATGEKEFILYNVSTPYSTINQEYAPESTTGANIFNDLGSGDVFAVTMIDRTTLGLVEIPLNSTTVSALNASIGSTFVMGGRADDFKTVPVPIWAIALLFGLISLTLFLRFRKRIFI
jgi:hypothetical protein